MFKAQSLISGIRTLADRTIRIQVDCNEMTPEDEAQLFQLRNTYGWFGFEKGEVADFELPKEKLEFTNQKSPSERLCNVMYLYHKKINGKPEEFEAFRLRQMERIIQRYKDLLD